MSCNQQGQAAWKTLTAVMVLCLSVKTQAASHSGGCKVDAFMIDPTGGSHIFKGAKYFSLSGSWEKLDAEMDFPPEVVKAGFTDLDAASMDPLGNVWLLKDGKLMGLGPDGAVMQTPMPFPATVPKSWANVDGASIAPDGNTYMVKGHEVMGLGVGWESVVMEPTGFPQSLHDAGFTEVDAFTIDPEGNSWFIKDGKIMGLNGDWSQVTQKPMDFPDFLTSALCPPAVATTSGSLTVKTSLAIPIGMFVSIFGFML